MIKVIGKRLLIPNKDRLIGFEGDNRTGRLYFSFRKDFFTEVFGSESDLSVSAKMQAPGASKAVAYVLTPVADLSSDKESVYELEILSGMVQAVGEIKLQLILLKDMGKDENQSDIPDLEWNSETQSFYACDSLDFETYSGSAGSAQLDAFKELLSEIGAKAQIASESAAASSESAASANGYAEAAGKKADDAAASEAACNASAGTASEKANAAAAAASAAGSYAASAKAFSETAGGLAEQAAASAASASAYAEAAGRAHADAESAKEAAETAKAAALNAANDAKNEAFAAKSLAQSAMDASVSARAGAKSASDNAAASLLHMNEAARYSEEAKAAAQKLDGHIANKDNPHEVTAGQLGAYTKTETDGKIAEAVTPVASDITALEGTVSGKLDKVSSYVRVYPGVYATIETDGTPHLITATSDLGYIGNTAANQYLPLYAAGGQLKTATPTADDSAANKEYVDGKVASVGVVTVNDVQIGRKSVVSDGVASIPISSDTQAGVHRLKPEFGLQIWSDGCAAIVRAEPHDIDCRQSGSFDYRSITPKNLDYAVKAAMCDGEGEAWTEAEQKAAMERIGFTGTFEFITSQTLDETVTTISFDFGKKVNEIYMLCESPKVTSVSTCTWKNENNEEIGFWISNVLSISTNRYVMTHFFEIAGVKNCSETRYGTNRLVANSVNTSYYELCYGFSKLSGTYTNGFVAGTRFTIWGR